MPPEKSLLNLRPDDQQLDVDRELATELAAHSPKLFEAVAAVYGERAAQASAQAFLRAIGGVPETAVSYLERLGWRDYIAKEAGKTIDFASHVASWGTAARYADEGALPDKEDRQDDLVGREGRVRRLEAVGHAILTKADILVGEKAKLVWERALARCDFDFKRPLTLRQIHLLSGVSMPAIQNAVSAGRLPVQNGVVPGDLAQIWIRGRREFYPSRWQDPKDDQKPFDREKVASPDEVMVHIPRGEDVPFTPAYVARPSKRGSGLSITIGAKGNEEHYDDFYKALTALSKMDVARWRRRNSAGNWGIVRARGAWIKVSKAEIDKQLSEIATSL